MTQVKYSFSRVFGVAALVGLLSSTAAITSASAETVFSIYGGANFSPHSTVKLKNAAGAIVSTDTVGWAGKSFEMPPYWGARATYWLEDTPNWGIALDYTHAKVYADPMPAGYSTLEFSDGINFFTANAVYRNDLENGWTPYMGAGLGLTVPHVEVNGTNVNNNGTSEYQVTGVAAQLFAGVDYKINDRWSVFGELKSNYGVVEAELKSGHSLSTNVISNQVVFGVSFKLF